MILSENKVDKRKISSVRHIKNINQVVTGILISFRAIIDQNIIENSLLITITFAVNLSIFWYLLNQNILVFIPLISITAIFLIFLTCYIAAAKKFYSFNILDGLRIYLKSEFARTPIFITFFYVLYIVFNFINKTSALFINSSFMIGILLVIIIIWMSYFIQSILIVVKPLDPIIYALNLLEKSLSNWNEKSYLDKNDKSKIYHAINISYCGILN